MQEHLDDLVHHHKLGFDVLTAPRDPVLADYIGNRDARVILDAVLPRNDVVVADTPPSLNDVVITALDRSDLVYVLATLDVPSLRNLNAFMDVLRRLDLNDDRVRLVMNKAEADVGVTVAQANDAFNGRFTHVLPTDRAVSRAVNLGTSVAVSEPRAKVTRAVVPVAEAMAVELGYANPSETTGPVFDLPDIGLLSRMWRRLLPGGTT
jgi:pilus assembly protein CpaE